MSNVSDAAVDTDDQESVLTAYALSATADDEVRSAAVSKPGVSVLAVELSVAGKQGLYDFTTR